MRFFLAGLLGLIATTVMAAPTPGEWRDRLAGTWSSSGSFTNPRTSTDFQPANLQPPQSHDTPKSNEAFKGVFSGRHAASNQMPPSSSRGIANVPRPSVSRQGNANRHENMVGDGTTDNRVREDEFGIPTYMAHGVFSGDCVVGCGRKVGRPIQVASNGEVPRSYQWPHQCWEAECKKDENYNEPDRMYFP